MSINCANSAGSIDRNYMRIENSNHVTPQTDHGYTGNTGTNTQTGNTTESTGNTSTGSNTGWSNTSTSNNWGESTSWLLSNSDINDYVLTVSNTTFSNWVINSTINRPNLNGRTLDAFICKAYENSDLSSFIANGQWSLIEIIVQFLELVKG